MTALGRLWQRAPIWRGALALAGLSTGLALFYPVSFTVQAPSLPAAGVSTYASPAQAPPTAVAAAKPPAPLPAQPVAGPAGAPPATPGFGQTFSQVVPFGGRLLPLPRGNWVVIVSRIGRSTSGQPVSAAVLAQLTDNQMTAALIAVGSASPDLAHQGSSPNLECQQTTNIIAHVVSDVDHGEQECWTIGTFGSRFWSAPNAGSLVRAALGELTERHANVPPLMVAALFHQADQDHWADLRYFFAPAGPLPAGDGDWGRDAVLRTPEKLAIVHRVQAWGERFAPLVRQSFAGSLTSADSALQADHPY